MPVAYDQSNCFGLLITATKMKLIQSDGRFVVEYLTFWLIKKVQFFLVSDLIMFNFSVSLHEKEYLKPKFLSFVDYSVVF